MKYIIILFTAAIFVSCSKDDKPVTQQKQQNVQQDDDDNMADTNLTAEEKFSAAILVDFLADSEDEDLAEFLETEIYKMGVNYKGVSVVEVTPSTWLVSFEKDSTMKNYLLQKYVEFRSNEYYFSLKETPLTITDILSRNKPKTSAGE